MLRTELCTFGGERVLLYPDLVLKVVKHNVATREENLVDCGVKLLEDTHVQLIRDLLCAC